jgi:hypothetical protein
MVSNTVVEQRNAGSGSTLAAHSLHEEEVKDAAAEQERGLVGVHVRIQVSQTSGRMSVTG